MKAGRLLIAERVWLNTQRLLALRCPQQVLSNVWWPISGPDMSDDFEKILTLWLNSTLGIVSLLANREETRGAWIDFKKASLERFLILDPRMLKKAQLRRLSSAFDKLSQETMLPFKEIGQDAVRRSIDDSLAQVLDLPDLSIVRELLSREPVIILARI